MAFLGVLGVDGGLLAGGALERAGWLFESAFADALERVGEAHRVGGAEVDELLVEAGRFVEAALGLDDGAEREGDPVAQEGADLALVVEVEVDGLGGRELAAAAERVGARLAVEEQLQLGLVGGRSAGGGRGQRRPGVPADLPVDSESLLGLEALDHVLGLGLEHVVRRHLPADRHEQLRLRQLHVQPRHPHLQDAVGRRRLGRCDRLALDRVGEQPRDRCVAGRALEVEERMVAPGGSRCACRGALRLAAAAFRGRTCRTCPPLHTAEYPAL